jgi:photosystem II stability/assembly factor-like uncharacterized protein
MEGTGGNLTCFAKSGMNLFAVSEGNGIYRSIDGGENWTLANSGLTETDVLFAAASDSIIFAGTYQGNIFRSTNNGTTWNAVFNAVFTGSELWSYTGYHIYLAVSGQNIYAGYTVDTAMNGPTLGRVFLSTDGGLNWDTTKYTGEGVSTLFILGAKLYLTTYTRRGYIGQSFVSTNNGTTWDPVGSGLEGHTIISMYSIDTNHFASTDLGLYLSTDNDTNWKLVGMEDCYLSDFANDGNNLFAIGNCCCDGTRIYVSGDIGANWTPVSADGFHDESYFPFALMVDGTFLYAGSGVALYEDGYVSPGGVWRRPLTEIVITEIQNIKVPHQFLLSLNYPNPFSDFTTISFKISVSDYVRLKIYNVNGQEVAILVNEEMKPGSYNATWNAGGFPEGIYFYKLESGSFVESRKMVVMR